MWGKGNILGDISKIGIYHLKPKIQGAARVFKLSESPVWLLCLRIQAYELKLPLLPLQSRYCQYFIDCSSTLLPRLFSDGINLSYSMTSQSHERWDSCAVVLGLYLRGLLLEVLVIVLTASPVPLQKWFGKWRHLWLVIREVKDRLQTLHVS